MEENDIIMKYRIETNNEDIGLNIIKSKFIKTLNEMKKTKVP